MVWTDDLGHMRLHLAPVSAAGTALHYAGLLGAGIPPGSLKAYVGLLGVLLGSAMGTLGSRVTSFGLRNCAAVCPPALTREHGSRQASASVKCS